MRTVANVVLEFIGPPLTRIRAANKRLLPFSVDLSSSTLEFQIELRARLLKDIEVVRSRLRATNGSGCSYHVGHRRRRPAQRASVRRTKITSDRGTKTPGVQLTITQRSQTVNSNGLL